MRLPSELWVKAYLRRLGAAGINAAVVRKGDADYGTVWIKVALPERQARLYGPAPEPLDAEVRDRRWVRMHKSDRITDADADAHLARARAVDSDLWILELEDRDGRHELADALVEA